MYEICSKIFLAGVLFLRGLSWVWISTFSLNRHIFLRGHKLESSCIRVNTVLVFDHKIFNESIIQYNAGLLTNNRVYCGVFL